MKTVSPVAQNASRAARALAGWAMVIAVVSSITSCAATSRRGRRAPGASAPARSPYNVLRKPSISAVATPDAAAPPAPSTPTSANCDPPVNASTDRAAGLQHRTARR